MLDLHLLMLNKGSKTKKPISKGNSKRKKMKSMNLFQVTKHNLPNNLRKLNNSMIMKSNKLKRDPPTPKVFTTKRCKIKLMSTRIESMKCLTDTRTTTMLLKKKKLPSKLICKTSLLKSKRRMKLWDSNFKIKISISKNLRSHMLIFKIVLRTKVIKSARSSPKKDVILMKKLKFFNLKLVKEKELSSNMRTLKKVLETKLKIRINNLTKLKLNMLLIKFL